MSEEPTSTRDNASTVSMDFTVPIPEQMPTQTHKECSQGEQIF